MTNETIIRCHICDSHAVTVIPGYSAFHRVTSDCKPWPTGGRLCVCPECGCAQAVLDRTWHEEAKQIYEAYTIYHQSQGIEQSVFDQTSGAALSRSARLLQRLRAEVPLPEKGRLMDVGCGNGALLRAFSDVASGWTLVGVEVTDHYRPVVEGIARVEGLFTGSPATVPGRFQLITLMHALEHIPSPREFIGMLWDKLDPGGLLLIQVPDCAQNPFMFLVADHATHFFAATLKELVESAGYEIVVATSDWIAKELTVVACKSRDQRLSRPSQSRVDTVTSVTARLDWLRQQLATVRSMAKRGPLGIFGTSIAATWLFAELDGGVSFFVDEDPNRVGRTCFGRPIYCPADAPLGSEVFIALPPPLAEDVRQRLNRGGVERSYQVPMVLPPT